MAIPRNPTRPSRAMVKEDSALACEREEAEKEEWKTGCPKVSGASTFHRDGGSLGGLTRVLQYQGLGAPGGLRGIFLPFFCQSNDHAREPCASFAYIAYLMLWGRLP
jgi:hypothetical protein